MCLPVFRTLELRYLSTLFVSYLSVMYLFAAGLLVWIGGPLIGFAAIDEYFGIGASIWVGAGAAVLGYTPLIQYVAIQRDVRDIWVQGTCEPSDGNWATGKPFFVTGGGECIQTGEQQRGGREVESEARYDHGLMEFF